MLFLGFSLFSLIIPYCCCLFFFGLPQGKDLQTYPPSIPRCPPQMLPLLIFLFPPLEHICMILRVLVSDRVRPSRAQTGKVVFLQVLGKLEGLTNWGGDTQTSEFYKGITIGLFTKFLNSFILDLAEGLGNYSLPSKFDFNELSFPSSSRLGEGFGGLDLKSKFSVNKSPCCRVRTFGNLAWRWWWWWWQRSRASTFRHLLFSNMLFTDMCWNCTSEYMPAGIVRVHARICMLCINM